MQRVCIPERSGMKLVLLIRSLEIGGAERQLVALARGLVAFGHDVRVLTFYSGGALRRDLEAANVPVTQLDKRGRWDVAAFVWRLVKELRREAPSVLYTFLPTANLVGLAAARLAGVPQIVWGVRASSIDLSLYDRLSRIESWLAGKLARYAKKIICNAHAGAAHHVGLGFPPENMIVIANGIDTVQFRFDRSGRDRVRKEWGVAPSDLLIGLPARLDPIKDHATALRAFLQLSLEMPDVKLACVGSGRLADSLYALSRDLELEGRVIWASARSDMSSVYSAFDISSSSSLGEGFSNTTAEAMACERVCVVTDVGDSPAIVGDTGWVVPSRSPEALARAWRRALTLTGHERSTKGGNARKRIKENFSISAMVQRTLEVLEG